MAIFIAVAQLKGGSGKSTLATNLAGYLSAEMAVGLIDADQPQGTSASWATLRAGDSLKLATPHNAGELVQAAQALDATCKVVIIDLPPRLHEISKAALIISDLVTIPVSGSAPEVWAVQDMLDLINQAREKAPKLKARLVWNKYRATRAQDEIIKTVTAQLGIKAMTTHLGNRTAYSEAIGRGLTVGEWPDQKARAEMAALIQEIRKEVKA